MRFLGLWLADRVPDARTIWLFREKVTKAGAIKTLFDSASANPPYQTVSISGTISVDLGTLKRTAI
jgi:hypothetical protein